MNNYPGSGIYDRLQAEGRYVVPRFIERTSQGVREYDPYAKLFEERVIFLGVQIDDASANDVMAQLLCLESMDPDRDIYVYINSPGGSFTALTAIYDTMQFIRPDIQTVCMGQAASAAAVILGAGSSARSARRLLRSLGLEVSLVGREPRAGASDEGRRLGASHLALLTAAGWGQALGFEALHLGGGAGGQEDSLFEYKRRFAPDDLVTASVGKAVHDEEAYRRLAGVTEIGFDGYFPAYRDRARSLTS